MKNKYYPFVIEKSGEKFNNGKGPNKYNVFLDNNLISSEGEPGDGRRIYFCMDEEFSGNFLQKYKCSELSENVEIVIVIKTSIAWQTDDKLDYFGLYREGSKIYFGFSVGDNSVDESRFEDDDIESLLTLLTAEVDKDKTLIRDSSLSDYVMVYSFKEAETLADVFRKLEVYIRKKTLLVFPKFEKKKLEEFTQFKKALLQIKKELNKKIEF